MNMASQPDLYSQKQRVVLMGASPGGFGTILSQNAWLPALRTLGTRAWFGGCPLVSRAQNVFDQNGAITDKAVVVEQLRQFVTGFIEFSVPDIPMPRLGRQPRRRAWTDQH